IQHLIVGYGGASGNWYYNNLEQLDDFSWYVLTIPWLFNQSFFMAFFFMLSGYFIPNSYDRKGANVYLNDRLKRLGIPLCIYILVVNPIMSYVAWLQKASFEGSFLDFLPLYVKYYNGLDAGVLWFIEALLLFSFVYALWRSTERIKSIRTWKTRPLYGLPNKPNNVHIICFGLILGGLMLADRTLFFQQSLLRALGLPQGHFLQYIVYFVLGIVAYRRNWFLSLTCADGKLWAGVTFLLLLILPGILVAAGIQEGKFSPYSIDGDWSWTALMIYAVWEQLVCISIIISLLVWCREELNTQNHLAKTLSKGAYATYFVHTPVVTLTIFSLRNVSLEPLIKFTIAAPITVILCFLTGHMIRKLPLFKEVF
ncbi:MAG: acyltransferase, partial [Phormidesmis sp. RL_2_1]|nr:acyltransferase [Phormidesmis sp. RL_2_1]